MHRKWMSINNMEDKKHVCVIETEVTCDGKKYKEFGDMTLCENKKAAFEAINNYNDGIPLYSGVHPKAVWYKRIINIIRFFIFRPKLSKEALEERTNHGTTNT